MSESSEFLGKFLSENSVKAAVERIRSMEKMNTGSGSSFLDAAMQPPRIDLKAFRPPVVPSLQEANSYQSSEAIVESMGSTVRIWREQLKSSNEEQAGKYQPVVLAYLSSGQVVQVQRMAPESFHCVRVEGALGFGGPPCRADSKSVPSALVGAASMG